MVIVSQTGTRAITRSLGYIHRFARRIECHRPSFRDWPNSGRVGQQLAAATALNKRRPAPDPVVPCPATSCPVSWRKRSSGAVAARCIARPTIAASSADSHPHPWKNHRPPSERCRATLFNSRPSASARLSQATSGQAAGFDADHDSLIKTAASGLDGVPAGDMRKNAQPASRNERITWITSPSCRTAMGRPQRRKTFSMGRLRESTSASSRSRPFVRAMAMI